MNFPESFTKYQFPRNWFITWPLYPELYQTCTTQCTLFYFKAVCLSSLPCLLFTLTIVYLWIWLCLYPLHLSALPITSLNLHLHPTPKQNLLYGQTVVSAFIQGLTEYIYSNVWKKTQNKTHIQMFSSSRHRRHGACCMQKNHDILSRPICSRNDLSV